MILSDIVSKNMAKHVHLPTRLKCHRDFLKKLSVGLQNVFNRRAADS